MKTNPASVHLRANSGFSLNYTDINLKLLATQPASKKMGTNKSIAWVYSLTALSFSNVYYTVSIEIRRNSAEVKRKWRT